MTSVFYAPHHSQLTKVSMTAALHPVIMNPASSSSHSKQARRHTSKEGAGSGRQRAVGGGGGRGSTQHTQGR
jgi:hypothetical protein